MKVTLVPKDSVKQRMPLNNVMTWFHSHGVFTFVFVDGRTRTYPDAHVWYVEVEEPKAQEQKLSQETLEKMRVQAHLREQAADRKVQEIRDAFQTDPTRPAFKPSFELPRRYW